LRPQLDSLIWQACCTAKLELCNNALQTAKLNKDVAIQSNAVRLEAAKIGLTTSAQRVASAWSKVSASEGITGGVGWSYSGSIDQ